MCVCVCARARCEPPNSYPHNHPHTHTPTHPHTHTRTHTQLHKDSSRFVAALKRLERKGHNLAAVILDGLLASETITDLSSLYVSSLLGHARQAGGLWIADEVQAGYGRTGSHMWCYQRWGIEPGLVSSIEV